MALSFDNKGFLQPDKGIEITHAEFREQFVKQALVGKIQRTAIFHAYETFLVEYRNLVPGNTEIWLDGSFVNRHKTPNDLDFVIQIEHDILPSMMELVQKLRNDYLSKGLDSYLLERFPEGHSNRAIYLSDRSYWMHHFSRDPRTKQKRSRPIPIRKGYLVINYGI